MADLVGLNKSWARPACNRNKPRSIRTYWCVRSKVGPTFTFFALATKRGVGRGRGRGRVTWRRLWLWLVSRNSSDSNGLGKLEHFDCSVHLLLENASHRSHRASGNACHGILNKGEVRGRLCQEERLHLGGTDQLSSQGFSLDILSDRSARDGRRQSLGEGKWLPYRAKTSCQGGIKYLVARHSKPTYPSN